MVGAALYVSPLGAYLLKSGGITYSFIFLGILFAVVTIIAVSYCPGHRQAIAACGTACRYRVRPRRLPSPSWTGLPAT